MSGVRVDRGGGADDTTATSGAFLDAHARLISRAVRRVCGRRHATLVPDVEQEVRLALVKALGGGKEIRFPTTYVYKVSLRIGLTMIRRFAAEVPVEILPEPAPEASGAPGGDLSPAERAVLLRQCMATLGEEPRRALTAYLNGLNHQEVAALYGWSEPKARHHIYRGIEALRHQGERETA